ncbi:MAG: hypothetical protein K2X03_07275 [Bryobacteraceae bacterium]|nr:hypothetical protein [Bryobacteraceae bacterium]
MPDLDQMLDVALATYVAEPPPGLAQRVQARVRSRRWPMWTALAVAALVLMTVPRMTVPVRRPVGETRTAHRVSDGAAHAEERRNVPHRSRDGLSGARTAPRRPAGVPMSAQERRLVEYAQTYPELFASAAPLGDPIAPLVTESLEMKPLEWIGETQ